MPKDEKKKENPLLLHFEAEKERHLDAAEAIRERASKDVRDLTEDERAEVKAHMKDATEYQGKIQTIMNDQDLQRSLKELGQSLTSEPEKVDPTRARTWGEAFVTSEMYRGMHEAGFTDSGFPENFTSPPVEFMAAVGDPLLSTTGSNSDVMAENFVRSLETPGLTQAQPRLAGLFAQVQTQERSVRYPIVTTRTKASGAVVAEGVAKPYAEYAFNDVELALAKRAAFIAISEEMVSDAGYVASYINEDLPLMVLQNEETAFATALYAAVTQVATATTIPDTGSTLWDAILAGITTVQVNYKLANPDALFIHPWDWAALQSTKAVAGTGGYFSGGPNQSPSNNLWGVLSNVVISSSATQGFPIVGAFKAGGKVFRKGGVRLDSSNSHSDFFIKNLLAIRAEVRSALGIVYPEAFAECALGTSS